MDFKDSRVFFADTIAYRFLASIYVNYSILYIYIYITIAWKSIDDIKVFDVIYQYFHL